MRERGTGAGRDHPALRHGLGATTLPCSRAQSWAGTIPPEAYIEDVHTPEAIQELAEQKIDEQTLRESLLISVDPDEQVARVREMEQMGAIVVCLQNMSGADPMGTIATYAEQVLPALRT